MTLRPLFAILSVALCCALFAACAQSPEVEIRGSWEIGHQTTGVPAS